jgi:integrase
VWGLGAVAPGPHWPGEGHRRPAAVDVAGFYRYAEEEGLVAISPAVHVRRPRLDYESHAVGLDRNEVGALLVAAGLGTPVEHALISLLALNGLRVSEAIGADIEALGLERTDWVSPEFDRSPGAMRGELVPLRGDERLRWVQRVDCQPVRATWVPVL